MLCCVKTNQDSASAAAKTHQQGSDAVGAQRVKLTFVDPAVNGIIVELRRELDEMRKKKDELQNELNATVFNPDRLVTFHDYLHLH